MRPLSVITDPVYVPKERNAIEKFFLRFIVDERDLPFVWLCLQITFFIVPAAIFLFTPVLTGGWWWLAASVYLVLHVALFISPFTLMLHNTSHRKFFKADYNFMNQYIPWVIGPFMGQSPELYYHHHIGMHHSEGNLKDDLSSTMPYQRDSFADFMKYYFSFMFQGFFELVRYFSWKKRYDFVRKCITGESLFMIVMIGLFFVNWQATLMVVFAPFFIIRFGMMAGNWGQHAFVDPNDPANSFLNSVTCINVFYNRRCFNDGYHIGHHLFPRMHWTDMARNFQENKDKYAEHKALVFEGIDFFVVWLFLMLKRYDLLARHAVNINNIYKNDDEFIAMVQQRLKKFNF